MQGVDVPRGRRARGHELLPVFMEFDEVEVVSAIGHGGGAGAGAFARTEKRQSRRKGQSFLAPGEEDVDAEFVHRDRNGGERRHAVHDEHDFGVFSDHSGDVGQRVEHSGGCFVVDEGDGVETALRKFLVHHFGEDGISPLDLQAFGLLAATFAHIEPLVGKCAAHAVEHLFVHQIADGAFHHTPSRGGGKVNRTRSAEEGLQARMHRFIQRGKLAAAVSDLRVAEGAEGFVGDFDGAGDEEFDVSVGGGVGGMEHGQFSQMKCSRRRRRARCLRSSRCGPSADANLS